MSSSAVAPLMLQRLRNLPVLSERHFENRCGLKLLNIWVQLIPVRSYTNVGPMRCA